MAQIIQCSRLQLYLPLLNKICDELMTRVQQSPDKAEADDALAQLYERHKAGIFKLISGMLSTRKVNKSELDHLTMETFIKIWINRDQFRGKGFFFWLQTTARRLTLDFLREIERNNKREILPGASGDKANGNSLNSVAANDESPEAQLIAEQAIQLIDT